MFKPTFAFSSAPGGSTYSALIFNAVLLPVVSSALLFFLYAPAQPNSYTATSHKVYRPTLASPKPILTQDTSNAAVCGIVTCVLLAIAGSALVFNGKIQPPIPLPPPPLLVPQLPPPSPNVSDPDHLPFNNGAELPDDPPPPPPPPPPTASTPAVDPEGISISGVARWIIFLFLVAYAFVLYKFYPEQFGALRRKVLSIVQSHRRRAVNQIDSQTFVQSPVVEVDPLPFAQIPSGTFVQIDNVVGFAHSIPSPSSPSPSARVVAISRLPLATSRAQQFAPQRLYRPQLLRIPTYLRVPILIAASLVLSAVAGTWMLLKKVDKLKGETYGTEVQDNGECKKTRKKRTKNLRVRKRLLHRHPPSIPASLSRP